MPSINQIEVRRGTSSGIIDTKVYDISGAGIGISAVADLFSIYNLGDNRIMISVKLRPQYDDFAYEEGKIFCVETGHSFLSQEETFGDKIIQQMDIYKSNGMQITGSTRLIYRHINTRNSGIQLPINILQQNSTITFLCHTGINSASSYYIYLADNNLSYIDKYGCLHTF